MTGADSDDGEVEPPRTFVEPFLEGERAVRDVLDDLKADLLVGDQGRPGARPRIPQSVKYRSTI
jgi:hypothetical protein